jgi:hypothetical protein
MFKNNESTSLRDALSKPRSNSISKYLNSEVNIAKLGNEVYNEKVSHNLFDINNINMAERYTATTQNRYLIELLKSSTPNYKIECKTFNFNTADRVGWIILEFIKNNNLSDAQNIEYTNDYIKAETGIEPTLLVVQGKTVLAGYFFPNAPTTQDPFRLKKYRYFNDVRKALTHTLEAEWTIDTDNYNEVKEYKNILDCPYKLTSNVFEIGIFQEMLDAYKESQTFQTIIKLKLAAGGRKSGETKKKMSLVQRQALTEAATEKKVFMSKVRLEETLKYILNTEEKPKFTIDNIVKTSKKLFDKGLSHRTVAKYLAEIKEHLNIE